MALTYDDLVSDTQRSLIRLSDYIGLRTPLADIYSTYPFTGRLGDRSSRIQTGRVLPARTDHGVEIDSAVLDEMTVIFDNCRRTCF
jgi:hypothetical protein